MQHEVTTENWKRLTDAEWTGRVQGQAGPLPADPAWAGGFMAP